jgi:hypothetical protein
MPRYRIHRMKEAERQRFRAAPHSSGATNVKPKDFEPGGEVEASSEYAAWLALRATERPLDIGDILESAPDVLRICKYVGFEEARWILPEVKSGLENVPPAAGPWPAAGQV